MGGKEKARSGFAFVAVVVLLAVIAGVAAGVWWITGIFAGQGIERVEEMGVPSPGLIYLYGEEHGKQAILEREIEIWSTHYHEEGMRDLFVELPYYTGEWLNLWMQADDDEILNALYADWDGTAVHVQETLEFYQSIKRDCPETVFHGTDVGHQYDTTGARYLEYLVSVGQEESEKYLLTQENIEQGRHYYEHADNTYRETKLIENFVREFDGLDGRDVMGIYGSAHTGTEAMEYSKGRIPCMANQLKQRYGDALYSENLGLSVRSDVEPERMDVIIIDGKAYEAAYFGEMDLSWFSEDMQYRKFWRLENAYDDFKDKAVTGNVLPYDNYPMEVQEGQIFVIDYHRTDGSIVREYHRADGSTWQGNPVTVQFQLD